MKRKSVVLLSSGLDSSVNLFEAAQKDEVVLALTFDYGQKAAKKEIEHSAKLAAYLKIPHKVLSLPWFKDFNKSSLLVESETVPTGKDVDIQSHEQSLQTAKSVWVPNRNGIFLNIGAAFAEALGAQLVMAGRPASGLGFGADSTLPDHHPGLRYRGGNTPGPPLTGSVGAVTMAPPFTTIV